MPARSRTGRQHRAIAALLWMVHPLQSEAVNYVTQRSESLMALFFLLTLYCAIRAQRRRPSGRTAGAPPARRGCWQVLSVAACACGMASKEPMVVAPLIVVLYDRTFEFDSSRDAWRQRRYFYAGLAAPGSCSPRSCWQRRDRPSARRPAVGAWTYLLNQAQMIGRYLRLSVWPARSSSTTDCPARCASATSLPQALRAGGARWRAPASRSSAGRGSGFSAAAFFLTLAPTSSVVPIASEVGAERRMYLPFAALATLAVVGGR